MIAPPSSNEQEDKPKTVNDVRIDVDLCFVCDFITTMQPYIKGVLDNITNLVAQGSSKLQAKLRVAFVVYRDYSKKEKDGSHKSKSNIEARLQSYNFISHLPEFMNFMRDLSADGGGGGACIGWIRCILITQMGIAHQSIIPQIPSTQTVHYIATFSCIWV